MSAPSDIHSAWASLFARGLASAGVRDVVLSPGSRSTPLALAFAREEGLRVTPVVDERSAAFFALGQARLTGRPSALLCTSGTAGAHYLPAIVEASLAHVPLVAITADRPWELADAGAPQTIDQTKLFGPHVRWFAELGLPDAGAFPAVLRIAARAVAAASHAVPGPVHVNARFRKPLEPVRAELREPWRGEVDAWMARGAPRVVLPETRASSDAVERLVTRIRSSERAVLVLGPVASTRLSDPDVAARLRRAVAGLATSAGLGVFAEAASQARFGPETGALVVPGFDALISAGALRGALRPDLLIEIFSPPTSGSYARLAGADVARVLLAEHGLPDPHGTAEEVFIGDPIELLERVAEAFVGASRNRRWVDDLSERAALEAAGAARATETGLSEPAIARQVVAALPDGAVLAIGNSLPIRDLDAFGGVSARAITVLHQRGASGIDGLVAGAAGARSVGAEDAPVVLVLGDVSAQHDLGSFALLAGARAPLVVVVVHNGGGRIFEELPIARDPSLARELEALFVTPPPASAQGLLAAVSRGFGVAHVEARDRATFGAALGQALRAPRATVVEAIVPESDGRARRAAHLTWLRQALASMEGS